MKTKLPAAVLLSTLLVYACASEDYNTQKGAAIGAIGGALAGQAIGHNTAGTLIGAAGGALVGAVAGNAIDQSNQEKRAQAQAVAQAQVPPPPPAYAPPPAPPPQEAPPGQWVDVPGEWVNGKWVPPHKAWVPVNPADEAVANVPPPPAYAPVAPPDMALIPGTYVYFVPGVSADIFFYHGYWYRPFGGRCPIYWRPLPIIKVKGNLPRLLDAKM